MTLTVPFEITVKVHRIEKNYTGKLTLSPAKFKPKTVYFLVLNPYGGAEAEFSIFDDEEMTNPIAEAVGELETGYNPNTGRPITKYDFGHQIDSPQIGLVTVATHIISEGIYHSEVRYRNGDFPDDTETPTFDFKHFWKKDFHGDSATVAESFLREFKLK